MGEKNELSFQRLFADCRSNSDYSTNGTAACECWSRAAGGVAAAKKEGCTKLTSDTSKAVKKNKNRCLATFGKCKKAEDECVGLIQACASGEVKTASSIAKLSRSLFELRLSDDDTEDQLEDDYLYEY